MAQSSSASSPRLRSRLVRGSAYAFAATVIGQVFALVTSIIYARLLGREGLGIVAIYSQLASLAVTVAGLELAAPITKFVAQLRTHDRAKLQKFLSTALSVSLAATLVVSAAFFLLADALGLQLYGNSELDVMIRIAALFLVLNSLATVGTAVLQGMQAIGRLSLFGILLEAATIPTMFLCLSAFGLVGAAIGGVLVIVLAATALFGSAWRALRRDGVRLRLGFDRESARTLAAYLAPLLASTVVIRFAVLYQNSFLALSLGYGGAGLFRVALTISRIAAFVPGSVMVPLFPALSELYATAPQERTRDHLTRILRVTAYGGAPVALAVGFSAGPVIGFLYGEGYVAAAPLAFVLVLAGFVDMITAIAQSSLLSEGRTGSVLALDLVQSAVAIATISFFVPAFGLMGVGYAAVTNSLLYGSAILLLLGTRDRICLGRVTTALVPSACGFAIAGIAAAWGGAQANLWLGGAVILALIGVSWVLMEPGERQAFRGAAGELLRRGN